MTTRSIKHLTLMGALVLSLGTAPLTVAGSPSDISQRRDSLRLQSARILQPTVRRELPDIRHQMLTSPQPVEIRQQGRNLCVTSHYNQLLPIYTVNGSLYSSFRISKGTNWLSGLPRGSYIINHQKYTIN